MKTKMIVCAVLSAGLLLGCESEKSESEHKEAKQENLMAQAKVSKDDAQRTALARVPNGMIKEGELEKEHGKLQWSFDIATAGTKDITEVNVNAITGEIISVDKESAESESKEKKDKD